MTSRISFSDLVRSEMKKLNWLIAVQALVFGLLMPFKVMIFMAVRVAEEMKYGYVWNRQENFGNMAGFGQIEEIFFILAAGILCAAAAFSYVHSSVKLDFYHSLPMKRKELFAVKVVSSGLTFVIPYVICQILTLFIGVFYGAVNFTIASEMLVSTAVGILHFLCSYAGTLLAVMLTGKMLTTFFGAAVFAGYVIIAYVLLVTMQAAFMPNSLVSLGDLSNDVLYASSPWTFCFFGLTQEASSKGGLTGFWPSPAYLCQLTAVIVIQMLAAVWLYGKRKTEAAGNALAFRKTEGVIKVLLTVMAGLWAALVAAAILDSTLWELVFILLFGGLACVIMEFIYRADIRQALCHKMHMVVTIVLAAGIFLFAKYDLSGLNSYLPEKDEIQSMAVRDNLLRIQYDTGNGYPKIFQTGLGEELLDYLETEDFARLYELAAEGAERAEEDIERYGGLIYIGVKYHLKNGKEVYRTYWVNEERYMEVMDELVEDQEYKEKLFPVLTWDEKMVKSQTASLWLPDAQMVALYREIQKRSAKADELEILTEDFGEEEIQAERITAESEITTATVDGTEALENKVVQEEMNEVYSEREVEEADFSLSSRILAADELWQVVQAYQKDLESMPYSSIVTTGGELNFHWNEQEQCYYGEYPLNIEFEHTMDVAAEVFKE